MAEILKILLFGAFFCTITHYATKSKVSTAKDQEITQLKKDHETRIAELKDEYKKDEIAFDILKRNEQTATSLKFYYSAKAMLLKSHLDSILDTKVMQEYKKTKEGQILMQYLATTMKQLDESDAAVKERNNLFEKQLKVAE